MKKYRTVSNYQAFNDAEGIQNGQFFIQDPEDPNYEPSLVRPDQSLTTRDLLNRFTRGGEVRVLKPQHLPGVQPGIPDEFSLVRGIDWSKMDKMDRVQFKKEFEKDVKALRKQVKAKAEQINKDNEEARKAPPLPSQGKVVAPEVKKD